MESMGKRDESSGHGSGQRQKSKMKGEFRKALYFIEETHLYTDRLYPNPYN